MKTYAKWYGVDRYTAYEDLDDERFGDPDWVWVGDRWMFVVGHTTGGAPFGWYEDEFDDLP